MQNNSTPYTVSDSTIIGNSRPDNNYLSPTIYTDLDHSNSNKITLRNISDDSNLSEGADGSSVLEETYATANEGVLIDSAQLVDRNVLTDLRLLQKRRASQKSSRKSIYKKTRHRLRVKKITHTKKTRETKTMTLSKRISKRKRI